MPIPPVDIECDYHCCRRTFFPLDLAFARTIHRFQGLSAGPVDKGKIPNMYECILCDPDVKSAEGKCTGLFYTGVSRGTTLGDENGLGSAVYFQGPNLTRERIQDLTKRNNSDEDYVQVQRRRDWVQHLNRNTIEPFKGNKRLFRRTKAWIKQSLHSPIPYDKLFQQTSRYADYLSNGDTTSTSHPPRKRQRRG